MSNIHRLWEALKEEEREYERLKGHVSVKRYDACINSIRSKRSQLKKEIEAEQRRITVEHSNGDINRNKNVKCFYCNKVGHYANNCWVKQALQEKERILKERERRVLNDKQDFNEILILLS